MKKEKLLETAGIRAIDWYLDTGDCFFCDVDAAPKGEHHQRHCTFSRMSDDELREVKA